MAAAPAFAVLPRFFEIRLVFAVFATLALMVAGPAYAQTQAKPPKASAVSQYVEMMPGAGGAKPSGGKAAPPTASQSSAGTQVGTAPAKAARTTAKAGATKTVAVVGSTDPVSAAFGTTGGGLNRATLLAIGLGAIAAAGAVIFALRRRLTRRQSG